MEKNTILIVDDQTDLRSFFRLALELDGFEIIEAENGREALERLRSLTPTSLPYLIFLDLMLPIMSGEEFLCTVSLDAEIKDIPVIVMSAAINSGKSKLDHASKIVRKPVLMAELTTMARHYTDGARAVH